MEDCPHNTRIEAVFEDYHPIGTVRVVQCTKCRKIVGTEYRTDGEVVVDGLGVNYEVTGPCKIIFPQF